MPPKGSLKTKRKAKKGKRTQDISDDDVAVNDQVTGQDSAGGAQVMAKLNKYMDEFYDLED